MDCPVCRLPMLVVEKLDVELDCCARCEGIWFDADEMELLLGTAGIGGAPDLVRGLVGGPAAAAREKGRPCPRCRKPMRKVALGDERGTLLDLCPRGDGIWLDRGELAQVVAVLGGTADARAHLAGYLGRVGAVVRPVTAPRRES